MKHHTLTSPKLLLLCLAAIGSSAALAQQLGAIPLPIVANPAFIQGSPSGSAIQPAQQTVTSPTAAVISSASATTPPAKLAALADDKAKPIVSSNAQPAEKPTPDAQPTKPEVNPMTGKTADIETLTHDYEVEKIKAAIATEKQKRMTAERSMNDNLMPTPPLSTKAAMPPAAGIPQGMAAPAQEKPVKVVKLKPTPVMPMQPSLAGTMMQNGERYAIIEQGGDSVVVKQGQTAFGQPVGKVSESGAMLGGMMLGKQSASVMRLARNDMPTTPAAGLQSVSGGGPLPAPLSGPGVNPSLPLTIPTQGQAPTNTAMLPAMGIPATGSGGGR